MDQQRLKIRKNILTKKFQRRKLPLFVNRNNTGGRIGAAVRLKESRSETPATVFFLESWKETQVLILSVATHLPIKSNIF